MKTHFLGKIRRRPHYEAFMEAFLFTIPNQAVFVGHVLSPTMAYSGQTLTRLVSTNTTPKITNTRPSVPVTVPVKYRTANTAAKRVRTARSMLPMFFFMIVFWLKGFG